jgi:hypothetical protein
MPGLHVEAVAIASLLHENYPPLIVLIVNPGLQLTVPVADVNYFSVRCQTFPLGGIENSEFVQLMNINHLAL